MMIEFIKRNFQSCLKAKLQVIKVIESFMKAKTFTFQRTLDQKRDRPSHDHAEARIGPDQSNEKL